MRLKISALIGAILLSGPAVTPVAQAADYRPLPPVVYGGWYVRADLGYKWYGTPTAIFDAPTFGPGYTVPGNGELFDETMSNAWAFGGGFGYDPVGAHRFDFTLDYETPSNFNGHLDCPLCGATFSEETADISAWAGLFNFYWDFEGHKNFKPYVGAGVGFSALTTTNVASDNPPGSVYPGATHWNFAWALMAGLTKDMGGKMKLDINYRYLNLGEARSGVISDGVGGTGFFQYQNIHAHEFRIGIRHSL
jgi:opacity protein-like surface antigen